MITIPGRVFSAPIARLATVTPDGTPHLVPIVFAVVDGGIISPIDHKPKTTSALQRIENIEDDPRVSILVDHYDDDWTALWWYRLDGRATVVNLLSSADTAALVSKYEPYRDRPPRGSGIRITVERSTHWSASAG